MSLRLDCLDTINLLLSFDAGILWGLKLGDSEARRAKRNLIDASVQMPSPLMPMLEAAYSVFRSSEVRPKHRALVFY